MDYKKLASDIVLKVGGTENIASVTNCMTRLRFKLKDLKKADMLEMTVHTDNESLRVVLNLIQRKDRQIDLMAKDLLMCGFDFINFGKATGDFTKDKEKLKQLYAKEV